MKGDHYTLYNNSGVLGKNFQERSPPEEHRSRMICAKILNLVAPGGMHKEYSFSPFLLLFINLF